MKKIVLIFLLAVVAIYAGFFRDGEKIANYPSDNEGIVAFGDSLVEGIGSSKSGGFVTLLSEDLDVPIKNLGLSGDTTKAALARIGDVTARPPALTIVLLGGNDYLQRIPPVETIGNVEKIIQEIQAVGSAVVLVGLGSGVEFEDLAERYKCAYVPDVLSGIYGNAALMSDSLHPNDEGYRLMVERIKPVVDNLVD